MGRVAPSRVSGNEDPEGFDLAEYTANAERWLKDKEGNKELKQELLKNLLVNLQIEKHEGQHIDRLAKGGASTARLSRAKYEKTSELVMMLMKELEREGQ